MKRYCKRVNICDAGFVHDAVMDCLKKKVKRIRPDTVRLFAANMGCSRERARKHLIAQDALYWQWTWRVTNELQRQIRDDDLYLPPVHVHQRIDGNSGKIRNISVQHIWQLLLDHVAVSGLKELYCVLGVHQVSGRRGMGGRAGIKFMRRWVTNTNEKMYFAKLDIRKYYESVNTGKLLEWLKRKVKNPALMHLTERLITTGIPGLNIGSYLSHFLANMYLADIWHYAYEKAEGVQHALFYMDDMLFIGRNKRKLKRSLERIILLIREKGLEIKPVWQIHKISHKRPVDIMGYRFSSRRVTLRKRIFRRARRSFVRFTRNLRRGVSGPIKVALRLVSYYGWVLHSDCKTFRLKNSLDAVISKAGTAIRNYRYAKQQGTIRHAAAGC